MTEVTDKPTLQLNDKNYIIEDLSDQARYIVAQLQDLKQQEAQTKARLDQIVVAAEGFKEMLEKQIEEDENPKPEEPLEGEVMQ
tara:strand:+ start:81 stop:332 length:252 start_codon:yes stop_codon:yes gene_type:complete